jgi:hypothetical protein
MPLGTLIVKKDRTTKIQGVLELMGVRFIEAVEIEGDEENVLFRIEHESFAEGDGPRLVINTAPKIVGGALSTTFLIPTLKDVIGTEEAGKYVVKEGRRL